MWADNSTIDFVYWANGEPNNYLDSEGIKALNLTI